MSNRTGGIFFNWYKTSHGGAEMNNTLDQLEAENHQLRLEIERKKNQTRP